MAKDRFYSPPTEQDYQLAELYLADGLTSKQVLVLFSADKCSQFANEIVDVAIRRHYGARQPWQP